MKTTAVDRINGMNQPANAFEINTGLLKTSLFNYLRVLLKLWF